MRVPAKNGNAVEFIGIVAKEIKTQLDGERRPIAGVFELSDDHLVTLPARVG